MACQRDPEFGTLDAVPLLDKVSSPRSWIVLAAVALAAVSAVTVGAHGDDGGAPRPEVASPPSPAPEDPTAAVDEVLRATVALEDSGIYGAGVLIDPPRGTILTALHVVEEMRSPRAKLVDGRAGRARVVATDKRLDLAILEAPELATPALRPPRFGDADRLRPGEEVYAIGSPRKLAFTVSRGIVSYVGREMEGARYVQLDMAINDGNSGGPVFNRRGEIVGVMSFILRRAQGLSFALPVSYAANRFASHVPQATQLQAGRRLFREWTKDRNAR